MCDGDWDAYISSCEAAGIGWCWALIGHIVSIVL